MAKKKWADLSSKQQRAVAVAGVVEGVMTLAVWRDLAKRTDDEVQGSRWKWALVALLQPVGPIAYFVRGRR